MLNTFTLFHVFAILFWNVDGSLPRGLITQTQAPKSLEMPVYFLCDLISFSQLEIQTQSLSHHLRQN